MRYEFSFRATGLSHDDIERLIDRISELVPSESISAEVKGGRLRIAIEGPARPPGSVRLSVQRALSEVLPTRVYRTRIDVREPPARGRRPPADVIAEALKRSGYASESEGSVILTQAPRDVVEAALSRLTTIWGEVSQVRGLSGSTRKAVALASYLTLRSPEELVEAGLRVGVLVRLESNKIQTSFDWRTAAERIWRMVSVG